MIQIAQWYDVTRTGAHLPEYMRNFGITEVICDARHVSDGKNLKRISVPHLKKFRAQLAKEGLHLAAVTVGWVNADVLDPEKGAEMRGNILHNIKALGAGGVAIAQLFLSVPSPADPPGRRQAWATAIDFCRQVAQAAKAAKVKVGVHGSQTRDYLITNLASYKKLFREVPSKWFGMTLCLGCLTICGSDAAKSVRQMGDRIVFVHARDLVLNKDGSWKDTNLGHGQVDYPAVKRALERVGFNGPIQPEHLGHVSFEQGEEITMANATGFLRAIFSPAPARKP